GVFFQKPCSEPKELGNAGSNSALAMKYYEGFSPPVSTVGIRSDLYRKQASELKKMTENLIALWTEEMTARVLKYVRGSAKRMKNFQGEITPMAFIFSGMPGDDNRSVLQSVLPKLKEISPHMAFISSKMCLNVKESFQYLCKQIMDHDQQFADYSDLRTDVAPTSEIPWQNLKCISASDLKCWFGKTQRPPIILCIEDIDLFPARNVQNIIMTFSCTKVPVIFLCGVTTCWETLDSFVPHTCSATFVYKTFRPISPEKRLQDFMRQILKIQDSPFQLSGEVIKYLSDLFLHEEFSIIRLEHTVRLCLLEHYRLTESILCAEYVYLQDKVLKSQVLTEVIQGSFSAERIKIAPRMKLNSLNENWSITSFVNSPKQTQVVTHVKDLEEQIKEFRKKQVEWRMYLEFLFVIVNNLPGIPEELKTIHSLYVICSNGALLEVVPDNDSKESQLDKAMGILKLLTRSKLEYQMTMGLKILKQRLGEVKYTTVEQTRIPYFAGKLEQLLKKLSDLDEEEKQLQEAAPNDKFRKPLFKSQCEFLEAMKKKAHQCCGQAYARVRDMIIAYLFKESKVFLKPLRDHPYAKVFIFDDVEFLREMITPNTHKRIHAALSEPEKFLMRKSLT
ncbi:unnamed protein product, partial [Allacma fusca]